MKLLMLLLLSLGLTHTSLAQSIDSDASKVTFEISNMGFRTVEGTFSGMKGSIQFDEQALANAQFDVCISAESVDTGNKKRDEHLRKEDFFDVEQYPSICFQSHSVISTMDGFMAKGTLSMKGITQEVELPFTYANNTFTGTLTLQRKDYKIGPNGSFMVGKTVDLTILCILQ